MNFIKIQKHATDVLIITDASDDRMRLVGRFLLDDIGGHSGQSRMQWLLNSRYQDTSSNYSFMEKEDNDVLLGCLHDEDPYERALTVPIPVMIDLLEQWDAVCKTAPKEIIITYQDGKFTVESK